MVQADDRAGLCRLLGRHPSRLKELGCVGLILGSKGDQSADLAQVQHAAARRVVVIWIVTRAIVFRNNGRVGQGKESTNDSLLFEYANALVILTVATRLGADLFEQRDRCDSGPFPRRTKRSRTVWASLRRSPSAPVAR